MSADNDRAELEAKLYKPLEVEPLEIRLIQIIPNDDHEAQMELSMTQVRLEKAVELNFRCLSYCWGDTEGKTILVNGFSLVALKNITGCLERLRARSAPHAYYWIDAICINQADEAEKTIHVAQMGRIYDRATVVIGWLGWEWDRRGDGSDFHAPGHLSSGGGHMDIGVNPDDSHFHRGITLLRQLAKAFRDWKQAGGQPWPPSTQLSRYAFDDPGMYDILKIDPVPSWMWKSLGFLISREWFSRAWIVQEASLAERLVLLCGFQDMLWDDFVQVSIFLHASGWVDGLTRWTYGQQAVMVPAGWHILLFANLQHIAKQKALPETNQLGNTLNLRSAGLTDGIFTDSAKLADTLQFFILRTLSFRASRLQDKLYAPRALTAVIFKEVADALPEVVLHAADADTYTRFTSYIVQNASSLDILSYAEDTTCRPRRRIEVYPLPSWVPDFSRTEGASLLAIPGINYDTLPGVPKSCQLHQGPNVLDVNALFVTKLKRFGPSFDQLFGEGDFLPLIRFALQLDTHKSDVQRLMPLDIDSLWRTLIGNSDGASCPASPATAGAFKTYLCQRLAVFRHGNEINPDLQQLEDWDAWEIFDTLHNSNPDAAKAIPLVEELKDYAEQWRIAMADPTHLPEAVARTALAEVYGRACGRAFVYRKLFVAEDGRLGLAPLHAQEGDQIWLLAGSRVPFLLEPTDAESHFKVVGEAYVHGVMHGESLRKSKETAFRQICLV